jgi:hypothetical protein
MPSEPDAASVPTGDIVFFVGTGRCGSSLVHEIVARHPDVGFVSNVDDRLPSLGRLGDRNNALYRRVPERMTRKGRPRFAPSEAYRLLDREVSPVVSEPFRDLVASDATPWLIERFRTFFLRRMAAQDTRVFTHKFTGWPRVGFIRAAFPEARIVHVVRDGRAVANSWLQMSWWDGYLGPDRWRFGPLPPHYRAEWEASDRSHVVLAGIAWKLLLDAFDAARAEVPDSDWLELRYEDVLDAPGESFARILDVCRLDMDPTLQTYLATHAPTTGRRASFTRDLDRSSLEQLDASLAAHLAARGYEVGLSASGA